MRLVSRPKEGSSDDRRRPSEESPHEERHVVTAVEAASGSIA
jgi:hypothetical protein